MNLKELITWVEKQGCSVRIKKKEGRGHQGLFYWDKTPRIVLFSKSGNKKLLFRTLVHEYCHFTQWKEKHLQKIDKMFGWQNYYIYLEDNKNMPRSKQLRSLVGVLILEHDCETRTLNLIKEKGWPINRTKYIKVANNYFFDLMRAMKRKKGGPSLVTPYSLNRLVTIDELLAIVMRL